MTDRLIEEASRGLSKILEGKVDSSHGLDHALIVVGHVEEALKELTTPLSEDIVLAIKLAALLHDADDRKFFSTSRELMNARQILDPLEISPETFDLVLKMIDLVSCSKNGNSREGVGEEWMLYPRFADRLEALGEIGLVRCWFYTYHVGRPLFTEETVRPKSLEELRQVASPERFNRYVSMKGKVDSVSFIDHFYDKLLHIGEVGSNLYFKKEATLRLRIMEEFLIKFGQTGQIDEVYLQKLADKYKIDSRRN